MDRFQRKGIYAIYCKRNNKWYIGKTTTSFYQRWKHHFTDLLENKHANRLLQRDFNRYGIDAFVFKIIAILDNNDLIGVMEKYYILAYSAAYKIYNIRDNPMRNKH